MWTEVLKITDEHIRAHLEALEALAYVCKGDMRQALSILRECFLIIMC